MTSNVLLTKSNTQTIFTVSCCASKTVGDFVQMAASNCNWICTYRNQGQKSGISVHQSVLSRRSSIAALIEKLKDVETDPSSSAILSGVKTTHINEYPLETYCALVQYLYTNEIKLEVDLDDFAIGCPPNKPVSASCKNCPAVDDMFTARKSSSTNADSDEVDEPGLIVNEAIYSKSQIAIK
ncbi:hypothetical protein BG006_003035 [Podila minutissima]|uniref:BTB domain-containing protein n=1 Tax=Podila minutissima TaxID=64525 RepID=A0A9P5SS77_9FUNG|nr:hypothetical protein BG006_003035 [Podila minutissima]